MPPNHRAAAPAGAQRYRDAEQADVDVQVAHRRSAARGRIRRRRHYPAPSYGTGNGSRQPGWSKWLNEHRRIVIAGVVIALALIVAGVALGTRSDSPTPDSVPLSQAISEVNAGKIDKAEIDDLAKTVVLTRTEAAGGETISTEYPSAFSDSLTTSLIDADVTTSTMNHGSGAWSSLLMTLLPVVLILGFLFWLVRSGAMTGGIGKLSGKRAKQIGDVPDARFSDVAGCAEAIHDMTELVEFLKDGDRFTRVGARPPRGALLVGPPGTGKTLLARAVAGEAGVPFFALAGSDFVETFAGVGAKRVRELFDKARKAGSAIVFIDEIDAVGKARAAGPTQGADGERENTLISLLNEMDGFDTSSRVIVLAATNRADVLDPALTRPGRLDRQIQVPAPDRLGRTQILAVHAAGKPISDDVDLTMLARRSPGMSGADLAQVVNEACMEAARRGRIVVDATCFDAALATVALGRARTSALVTDFDRKVTAWHEAGHTVAALLLPAADDPVQVSIVPRGPAGGVTWMSGNDDVFLTRGKALADLRVAMGGRAAEELLLDGEYTQGAHGDLDHATKRALAMVTKYGMSRLGYLLVDDDTVRMGGDVGVLVREVAEELLTEAHEDVYRLLEDNRPLLDAIAEELLDKENLTLADLRKIQQRVVDQEVDDFVPAQRSEQDVTTA
ncbi:MAG TPA: AAA family ATPase [Actinomycetales bacterium]|nr:AAA family ATPase [Actinomycetales bacterium]